MKFAMCEANDIVGLDFPYQGARAYITVRNKRGNLDVMFQLTKGQLHHSYDEDGHIKVRFDDEKPENYYCNEPSDGSSNTYFIKAKTKFLNKLKKSKKVYIETEFYTNGLKVMEFNTAGLEWK